MPESKDQPLHASTSEAVTNNVRVEVESQYAPEHSQPFQNEWFFHYTVRITNEGDDTVQLLSRHWIITDATGRTEEVKGPGVVGEQPVLGAGRIVSVHIAAAALRPRHGVMRGTYQMVDRRRRALRRRDRAVRAPRALHRPLMFQLRTPKKPAPASRLISRHLRQLCRRVRCLCSLGGDTHGAGSVHPRDVRGSRRADQTAEGVENRGIGHRSHQAEAPNVRIASRNASPKSAAFLAPTP